jgi:hypothetical protein
VGGANALSFETDIWPVLIEPRRPALSGASDSCSGANGCHLTGAGGLSLPSTTNLIDAPSNRRCANCGWCRVTTLRVVLQIAAMARLGRPGRTDLVRQWCEGAP